MTKKMLSAPMLDPITARIKQRRKELGLSLAELAQRAGLKAASYVLRIERGEKVPSETVAAALAAALGENPESFKAWARLRSGAASLDEALRSAKMAERAVAAIGREPRHRVALSLPIPPGIELPALARGKMPEGRPSDIKRLAARVRASLSPEANEPILLLKAGADPERLEARQAAKHVRLAVDVDENVRREFRDLVVPFAYRLTEEAGRRAPALLPPGFYAILTQRFLPLEPHEIYAVRVGKRVELGHVHWDGERLALLPYLDPEDLVLLPARSERDLVSLLAGKVAIVTQAETIEVG